MRMRHSDVVFGLVMVRAIEGRLPGAVEGKRRVVDTFGVLFFMMCFDGKDVVVFDIVLFVLIGNEID